MTAELGAPVELLLERRHARGHTVPARCGRASRRQAAAEQLIRTDPVVLALMDQFKTARIVPGSIKPV